MELSETKHDCIVILTLKGRLDANTAKLLEASLLDLINNRNEHLLVVDFQHVNYISSAGLRVLLMAAKILKSQNGKMVLTALKEHLKEIFEITGFHGIFPICDNQEGAITILS
jgi:anti-sigma B factor antagonist